MAIAGRCFGAASEAIGDRATAIDTIIGRLRAAKLKATYETAEWENTGENIRSILTLSRRITGNITRTHPFRRRFGIAAILGFTSAASKAA